MSHKHSWTWKYASNIYWVCCQECGKSDRGYGTEELASQRVQELKAKNSKPGRGRFFG